MSDSFSKKFPPGPPPNLLRSLFGAMQQNPLDYFTAMAQKYGDVSGMRIGQFRSVWLKPNETECRRAIQDAANRDLPSCVQELAKRAGRPVFCTRGDRGIVVVDPTTAPPRTIEVPAYPVSGPTDVVGAGDSTNAGIGCALAAGADLDQAAAFGCLVASITIQQIGTTGTATPQQIRQRWQEILSHGWNTE